MNRSKKIIKISIYGIVVNILLVIFKAVVGFAVHSIAIILDALNNLTDAFSSLVTIIGAKLSNKKPDKKHPYGYGRIEYFSSVIIAVFVLLAGLTSFKESIEHILSGEKADYSVISLVIVFVAVLVKFFFGRYARGEGKKLNSGSLVASGTDAISDSILSFSTFLAGIISIYFKISMEGYLGVVISIFIIKAALEILNEAVDEMIGVRADRTLVQKLKRKVQSYEGVEGVYDVTVHNYGPNQIIATLHIQVNDHMEAKEIHHLTKMIAMDIYEKYGIILTIGIYAFNDEGTYGVIRETLSKMLKDYPTILQMHGFYVDEDRKSISFDLIFDFSEEYPEKIEKEIAKRLKEQYPDYRFIIVLDNDYSFS